MHFFFTSGDGATYTYDARNRQVGYVKGSDFATYTYYPSGLRKTKTTALAISNYIWDGSNMICEYANSATSGKVYTYGHTLISQGNSWYYLYNAHGDVVKYINANGAVLKSYDYDAFGEEADPSTTDTNPFRYAGQYFDDETGTYYLRARYYDPGNGRFSQEDTHWNTGNMLYGDDPLKLGEHMKPNMDAIVQSSNLYTYCIGNPVKYVDVSGDIFVEAGAAGALAVASATNIWNPIGWVIGGTLAVIIVVGVGESIYNAAKQSKNRAVFNALRKLDSASTASPPPPPDDPNGRGTKTNSTKLYNKDGVRIDVENPGTRPGQIHVHYGNKRYIYDVAQKAFKTSTNQLAPNSIQNLLGNEEILKAIAKGLEYLGY